MAFLERLKTRLDARPPGDAPAKLVAPRLKARFTAVADILLPYRRARILHAAPGREDAPPDPAKIFLPVGAALEDDESPGLRGPLSSRLQYSAAAIVRRRGDLEDQARTVSRAIGDRVAGAVTMAAMRIRFLIALLWGLMAAQFAWGRLTESAAPIIGFGPVAPADYTALGLTFAIAAAAGIVAAFLGSGAVAAAGNADNKRVRARAALFGDRAADLALQFDTELDNLRREMDDRQNPVEAVAELSRAHLTALEAAVFFRDIQFLTDDTDASHSFRGYLARASRGLGAASEVPAFFLGVLFGMFGLSFLYGPPPVEIPQIEGLKYPQIVPWMVFGAFAYAITGLVVENLRGLVTWSVANEARDEALDAVRSGFVARKAPRVEDVIRRIDDALDVYKARVGRGHSGVDSRDDDTPAWRKAPEGPRFVETAFAAAPKAFMADPKSGRLKGRDEKNAAPETAPKRGLFAHKNPAGS